MIVIGTNISMIRGDTESILVSVKDSEGFEVALENGDIVYLTIKDNINTDNKALQKIVTEFPGGRALIEISSDDTKDLKVKEYIYDIQLTKIDGSVTTIVKPSKFTLLGDVTRE